MNASVLAVLQHEQQRHDEMAHRDILALDPQRRITHMALHFAKYSGRLVAMEPLDRRALDLIIIDSVIICLASANALGLSLDQHFEVGAQEALNELAAAHANLPPFTVAAIPMWMGTQMAVHNGKIAKACEAFDHKESFPYQEVLSTGIVEILRISLAAAGKISLDLSAAIRSRWEGVEKKLVRRAA